MPEEHKPVQNLTVKQKVDLLWERYEEGRDRAAFRAEVWAGRRRVAVAFAWIVGVTGGLLGVYNALSALLAKH